MTKANAAALRRALGRILLLVTGLILLSLGYLAFGPARTPSAGTSPPHFFTSGGPIHESPHGYMTPASFAVVVAIAVVSLVAALLIYPTPRFRAHSQ